MAATLRLRCLMAAAMVLSGCDHSPTYSLTNQGAVGPFRTVDGVAQLTTGGSSAASWTADGGGILGMIHGGVPGLNCMGILPPGGGSATWNRCPVWPRMRADTDSTYAIGTPIVGATGRVLYVGAIGPIQKPSQNIPFPVSWHAELFLFDTSQVFTNRRAIATLYHDHVGISAFGPNEVSWLDRIRWVGQDSFIALGENLNPNSTITPLRIVVGVISASGAVFTPVASTEHARLLSVAEGGQTVLFVRDTLTLERVTVAGAAAAVVVALPPSAQRNIIDISCQDTICLLLTREPGGAALWTVTTTGADLKVVRSFTGLSPTTAQLSPSSGDVLLQMNGQLYLIAGLVPH